MPDSPTFPSLQRAAADACLRQVFGDDYGALVLGQDSLLIDDLCAMDAAEGRADLYTSARVLAARIAPASLASYVATLEAGRDG